MWWVLFRVCFLYCDISRMFMWILCFVVLCFLVCWLWSLGFVCGLGCLGRFGGSFVFCCCVWWKEMFVVGLVSFWLGLLYWILGFCVGFCCVVLLVYGECLVFRWWLLWGCRLGSCYGWGSGWLGCCCCCVWCGWICCSGWFGLWVWIGVCLGVFFWLVDVYDWEFVLMFGWNFLW